MENTHRQLTALNTDSLRALIDEVNDRQIMKDDILGSPICIDNSYYLLYYEDLD